MTGATGDVGREVVRGLLAAGRAGRVAVPRPLEARTLFGDGPRCARLVFGDETTYGGAFGGAQALFLVRPPQIADVKAILPALRAAQTAGVRRVVFFSLQGAGRNPVVPHRRAENHLEAHGPAWTFLRPGFFMPASRPWVTAGSPAS